MKANNTRHTPGPWVVGGDDNTRTAVYAAEPSLERSTVAHVTRYRPKTEVDHEAEANARLIAAAPDLLDALKRAARIVHGSTDAGQVIRAAIAKAEGGAR